MSNVDSSVADFHSRYSDVPGPVTRRYQRRTLRVYVGCIALGLLPLLTGLSGGWQAAGLGLWLPGAGFVAVGGWSLLLFPVTLVLFAASIVAWFWAGMVVAPVAVWLGSALLSASLAPAQVSVLSYVAVGVLLAAGVLYVKGHVRRRNASDEARAKARDAFVPSSLAEVRERSNAVPAAAERELSEAQLESLRYLLDRSLQPVDQFSGFDVIEQFQPAALRYQINHMGFALGIAQGAYLPNFSGYMHEAQRNLIEKYVLRKVWGYWVYESMWGHLNFTDFDPAGRDNIMLTGWFGMHVGQYMLNSGDRHYGEPGSLAFRLNDRTQYSHDLHTLVESLLQNYERYSEDFCLYPCEPNWMYPICNHYGMSALACYDRLYGTGHARKLLPTWLAKLDSEFTDRSGSIIGLRSQLTGIRLPFPVREFGYATFAHCFAPERGERLWAVARKELEPAMVAGDDGQPRFRFPGQGLDPGNYRPGFAGAYGSIMAAAREFGDAEIADAAQRSLDADCSPHRASGSLSYLGGSNIANASIAMARLMQTGDFRRAFVEGPADETLSGPCLAGIDYPDLLVARAYSEGNDLDLVLYPGEKQGVQAITIERLEPERQYEVTGAEASAVTADARGQVKLPVRVDQRTSVRLTKPRSGYISPQ